MKYFLKFAGWIRCVVRLGPWQAFKLLVLAPRLDRRFLIRARGFQHPILIRGKTSDCWVFNSVIVCKEYEPFIVDCPKRILDGGANIGLASLFWAHKFQDAEIVAIEPDVENFELLELNTRHTEQVNPVNSAIWSRRTNLTVQYPNAEKYAFRVLEDENGRIKAHSVDSIMKDRGWDWIDVVKLDVEGSEVQILSENTHKWIDKIGTLIIELHQDFAPESAQVLFKAFSDQKFHLAWRGENLVLRRITG